MKVGDKVTRILCGIEMPLVVTQMDDYLIYCGPYKFSKNTGAEIDEELDWNNIRTGSYLKEIINESNVDVSDWSGLS